MVTPFLLRFLVAAAALAGSYSIQAWNAFKSRPPTAHVSRFYKDGFRPMMTLREAALILKGEERRALFQTRSKKLIGQVMVVNHPDADGSTYLASKMASSMSLQG